MMRLGDDVLEFVLRFIISGALGFAMFSLTNHKYPVASLAVAMLFVVWHERRDRGFDDCTEIPDA